MKINLAFFRLVAVEDKPQVVMIIYLFNHFLGIVVNCIDWRRNKKQQSRIHQAGENNTKKSKRPRKGKTEQQTSKTNKILEYAYPPLPKKKKKGK